MKAVYQCHGFDDFQGSSERPIEAIRHFAERVKRDGEIRTSLVIEIRLDAVWYWVVFVSYNLDGKQRNSRILVSREL